MSVSSTQPQTEDQIELNKLYEILSQSECLNVHPENSNVPIETSNLSTLQTQEQPNRVNSGLNRTFIFNNKVRIYLLTQVCGKYDLNLSLLILINKMFQVII